MAIKKTYLCFKINSINQAQDITSVCQTKKIVPIFFIHFYIINGLGIDWIIEFRNLLLKKFKKGNFKIYVDCGINYGLFISLVKNKLDFLKVKADVDTLSKLKQIANKNKISINPKIAIIDVRKIQNIEKAINKMHLKNG